MTTASGVNDDRGAEYGEPLDRLLEANEILPEIADGVDMLKCGIHRAYAQLCGVLRQEPLGASDRNGRDRGALWTWNHPQLG